MVGGYVILDKAISEQLAKALYNLEESFAYEGAYKYLKEIALRGKPIYLPSFEVKDVPSPGFSLVIAPQFILVQCLSDIATGISRVVFNFVNLTETVQVSVSSETPNIFDVLFLQGE